MKLKFKKRANQTNAVEAVADCFAGQPKSGAVRFRIDPGRSVDASGQVAVALEQAGFKNADLVFPPTQLLYNIRTVQRRQDLPESEALVSNKVCAINLDIEMETSTGKIYCYIKSIVEHIAYDPVGDTHSLDIFTQEKPKEDFNKAIKTNRHVYDYAFTDSKNERNFVTELDTSSEVVVYAKLPRGFFIPTPVGNYNPDWAIAFQEGKVKHVYFVAETKGSMSTMDLRAIEESKIKCARKFFEKITSSAVKYDVVDSYGKLMELVKQQIN